MDENKKGTGYNTLEDERIKQMLSYIQEHYSEKITVEDILLPAYISVSGSGYRLFQTSLGETPGNLWFPLRLQKAQELLRYTDKSVLEWLWRPALGPAATLGKF